MKLDYSPPPFTVHLGSFEITKYLTAWEIRSPALELNSLADWSGDFEVFFTNRFGLIENDLSEQYHPERWRPAQAQVLITVMGRSLPVMRIDRYAYDPQTRTGKGSLVQYTAIVSGNKPSAVLDTQIGAQVPLKEVVEALIDSAMEPARIKKFREITGVTGVLDSAIATKDPMSDAQKFCGVNWQWITVNSIEKIVTVNGDPARYPVLMYRSIGQVEWQPDHDAIYFAADKVIVTGACQVPDPGKPCGTPNPNVDAKGRTKRIPTSEMQPFKTIFPGPYSSAPTIAEEKVVMFAYRNEPEPGTISFGISSYINFINFETGFFDPYDLMRDLDTASSISLKDVDEKTAIHTVTVKSWPAGRIFPRLGANTNLHVVEIEVVSPFIRAVWVPEGLLRPETGDNFTLVRKSREVLSADRNHGCGGVNPKTGSVVVFEDKPKAETAQPAPLTPLKTVSIRAECTVANAGWVPLIQNPYIVEVGFLPSQSHADNLANQISQQQVRRRNLVHIAEPLRNAIEWLDAGCPVVGRVRVHDGEFGFESVVVGMAGGEAKFSIACGRIALINPPIHPPPQPVPYSPSASLQLLIPSSVASQVGVPIALTLVATGGNP